MSDPLSPDTNSSQIKITANSAEEAVKLIKERFGDKAKVLKVQQVEQRGLKGLIGKPKLEIFVSIPNPAATEKRAPAKENQTATAGEAPKQEAPVAAQASKPQAAKPLSKLYSKNETSTGSGSYFGGIVDDEPEVEAAPEPRLGSAANPVRNGTLAAVKRAISMMEAVGFDTSLIERVRAEIDFKTVGSLPAVDLYSRICDWLKNNFPDTKSAMRGTRRAFIGTCGSGKTSALCKALSADVFINGMQPSILKVDTDVPNSSDGLEAFCEIMGCELARSIDELEGSDPDQPLYIDMPGLNVVDDAKVEDCKALLDGLDVDERILVVNAAYDSDLISAAFDAGRRLGARYAIFTHLDEAIRVGKLWKFALNGATKPLFVSHGSNPAGDYTFDVFSYLLERSFPNGRSLMSSQGKSASPRSESHAVAKEGVMA